METDVEDSPEWKCVLVLKMKTLQGWITPPPTTTKNYVNEGKLFKKGGKKDLAKNH